MQTYYAHGKLLLSGEYFVLEGAEALAIPTRLGQSLSVDLTANSSSLHWISTSPNDEIWLDVTFDTHDFRVAELQEGVDVSMLQQLLREARKMNPEFLNSGGFIAKSHLEFPLKWGLGSSSTLIANIAQWAAVDPFQLLFSTLDGSGYDIACANNSHPIIYKINNKVTGWKEIGFTPDFQDQLYFVYLDKKQNSREGISTFRKAAINKQQIDAVSALTHAMAQATRLGEFQQLMEDHEQLVSAALNLPRVKQRLFADFNGSVKSLGAWGGDFVMAAANGSSEEVLGYFKEKGFSTVMPYKEVIFAG